jgi:uncharacterized protein DUF6084
MAELSFECTGAEPDPFAVGPTMNFAVRISEATGVAVDAIALRCQLRIEPHRRRYGADEAARMVDLFGERGRWSETVQPMQLATVSHLVGRFAGTIETTLPVPFTYDLEVAAARYFQSLADGVVPLLLLFSGTVFVVRDGRLSAEPVPWHHESRYALPVERWQQMMERAFPGTSWLRFSRSSIDALRAYAASEAIPTWDLLVERLLKEAGWPRP